MAISTSHKYLQLHARGKALDLSTPRVMGIVNVTPDSFSDGGLFLKPKQAVQHIRELIAGGADIIDIGGESTRPGSDPVPAGEELERILPVLAAIRREFPDIFISVDTTKAEVAGPSLESGADIINDVGGLQNDPEIATLCAQYDAGLVIMHSKGNPKTMQINPEYDDVVEEVYSFLDQQTSLARKKGARNLVVDPGIGFGKTLDHNLSLLAHLQRFTDLGYPVLIGASRKSLIQKLIANRPTDERLPATLAIHYDAMIRGASILRVHDVRETMDTVRFFEAIRSHE
ncbi:MAG TPA: dihydropteroate synthase [Balneolales bacterium]|nr:dihydropteroate synthase [Balneolales bacterium]